MESNEINGKKLKFTNTATYDSPVEIVKMEGIDGRSFEIVGKVDSSLYIKDKNSVYILAFRHDTPSGNDWAYRLQKIDGLKPENFKLVKDIKDNDSYDYIEDSLSVFWVNDSYSGVTFKLLKGADLDTFKSFNLPDSFNKDLKYTAEDKNNYYIDEVVISKNTPPVFWLDNPGSIPLSCKKICPISGFKVAENQCYDNNFKLCTVKDEKGCIPYSTGEYTTKKPYKFGANETRFFESCCCGGGESRLSHTYDNNGQKNVCVSSDGFDPFVPGTTKTSITNKTIQKDVFEDTCIGDKIQDYSCDIYGQSYYQSLEPLNCPNGCKDGACLPGSSKSSNTVNPKIDEVAQCQKLIKKTETYSCIRNFAFKSQNILICEDIDDLTEKNWCYSLVASAKIDLKICDKITIPGIKWSCFDGVSLEKKDPSICQQIGSQLQKDICYANLAPVLKDKQLCQFIIESELKAQCLKG